MSDKNNNYEWLGDDVSESELTGEKDIIAKELMGEEYSKGYFPPIRVYDNKVKADSFIVIKNTSVPAGHWAVTTTSAGSFIVTSTDDESNETFKYLIF